jgi:hypothetical protein
VEVKLKKVKFHEDMSDETYCFSADVWVDGKRVATAQNQGCGGDTMVRGVTQVPSSRRDFLAFEAHCYTLPPTKHDLDGHVFEVKSTPDSVVDDLFEEWLKKDCERKENAQIRRWCKTKTLFQLKGDPEGSWRTIKAPYSDEVREHIARKYGDRLEEIANERYV